MRQTLTAVALVGTLIVLGACGGQPKPFYSPMQMAAGEVKRKMETNDLKPGGFGYVQVTSNDTSVPGMGAIVYRNREPDKFGREIVVVAAGVSPNIWQAILPAMIDAGGTIAGGAVYGLSVDAARTIVNATAGGGSATAAGGSGGSAISSSSSSVTCSGIAGASGDDDVEIETGSGIGSC